MQHAASNHVLFEHVESVADDGVAPRGAIGLVVLASDQTIEYEFNRVFSAVDGVGLYCSRVAMDNHVTPATLAAMEGRIAQSVSLLLPGSDLDVVAYGCTSASMVLGEESVFDKIHEARPGIKCTTPITAGFAALRALGAMRIAVVTPYSDAVNERVLEYMRNTGGFDVRGFGSFHVEDDRHAPRISESSIVEAASKLGSRADVDGVFISCTSLRVVDVATRVEQAIGKPVTGSNHAMAWHTLRLCGIDESLPQFGRLFTLPAPTTLE